MKAITEKTLVPISLVIVLIGGVVWLSEVHGKVNAMAKNQDRLEGKQDRYQETSELILRELGEIKGEIKHWNRR